MGHRCTDERVERPIIAYGLMVDDAKLLGPVLPERLDMSPALSCLFFGVVALSLVLADGSVDLLLDMP